MKLTTIVFRLATNVEGLCARCEIICKQLNRITMDKLHEVDFILAQLEDTAYGDESKKVGMARKLISELIASNGAKPIVSGALPLVEQSLLDEAISDVITISTLNEYSIAKKLISEQFIVIDKQDLIGNDR